MAVQGHGSLMCCPFPRAAPVCMNGTDSAQCGEAGKRGTGSVSTRCAINISLVKSLAAFEQGPNFIKVSGMSRCP